MPPSIPDRWIPYKACGNIIEGTRIVCFKVPLKKSVQKENKGIKEIWDIPALLKKLPTLGAVIDLTNTSRYYNPQDLVAAGVIHKKLLMPGRIIPPEEKVLEFMDAVDEFMGSNSVAVQAKRARRGLSTTEALLGVHCTHGLNRTGYMVCRYLRDRLGVPANIAIKKFERARGYQIERDNYKQDLLRQKPAAPYFGGGTEIISIKSDVLNRSRSQSPLEIKEQDCESKSKFGKSKSSKTSNGRLSRRRRRSRQDSDSDKSNNPNREYDFRYDY